MKITKKEIRNLLEAGKLNELQQYIISDNTKADKINALQILFKKEKDFYNIEFESLPYSRGGRYKRHTSTLHSVQSWELKFSEYYGWYIATSSSSNSANCPPVDVPIFYTEAGRAFHNQKIQQQIDELKSKML